MTFKTFSPSATARLAGLLYLLNAACGLWAEAFVRGKLVVGGDPAATAANILAHAALWRSGFAADLLSQVFEVAIALLFWRLFAPVSRGLAAAMVAFRLVWSAVFAMVALLHLAPLLVLQGAMSDADALAAFLLRLHGQGYEAALVFFGIDCILIGLLIWRGGFLPKALGALMLLAGGCYELNSFSDFLWPELGRVLGVWPLLPCALAEYALILWLLIVGVNETAWRQIAPRAGEV